jgi:hypothetical protein
VGRDSTASAEGGVKLYLAGPISGIPFFNFPAFHAAEDALRAKGHVVYSPARFTEGDHGPDFSSRYPTGDPVAATCDGFDIRMAMAWNLLSICTQADALALLPGWEQSNGTAVELAAAQYLGLPAYPVEELL